MSTKTKALLNTIRGAFDLALDAKQGTAAAAALNLAGHIQRNAQPTAQRKAA